MARRTKEEYVALAEHALIELIREEGAILRPEAQAKLSDRRHPSVPVPLDPHHITTAFHRLAPYLRQTIARTRGGRAIGVWHLSNTEGILRKVTDAAARKRLLHARYLSWATGTKTKGRSLVGEAGEQVVHASLRAANGYTLVRPNGGDVTSFLGAPVPGGPLDNAALLLPLDAATGLPHGPYAVPIEVKNVQQWLYPENHLLHQLLFKAASLQAMNPNVWFVPVLVCRKAHYLTTLMARQMGFYVLPTIRQYIAPSVASDDAGLRSLNEVRDELGYLLEPHNGEVPEMVKHFNTTIPSVASRTAELWRTVGSRFAPIYEQLRKPTLSQRSDVAADLATAVSELLGEPVSWYRTDAQLGSGFDE